MTFGSLRLLLVLLAAGAPSQTETEISGSFEGTLPCADCPGIAYRIDLFTDRTYYLRERLDPRVDCARYRGTEPGRGLLLEPGFVQRRSWPRGAAAKAINGRYAPERESDRSSPCG